MSKIMGQLFLGLIESITAIHAENQRTLGQATLAEWSPAVRSFPTHNVQRLLIMVSAPWPCTRCPTAILSYSRHHPDAVATGNQRLQRAT